MSAFIETATRQLPPIFHSPIKFNTVSKYNSLIMHTKYCHPSCFLKKRVIYFQTKIKRHISLVSEIIYRELFPAKFQRQFMNCNNLLLWWSETSLLLPVLNLMNKDLYSNITTKKMQQFFWYMSCKPTLTSHTPVCGIAAYVKLCEPMSADSSGDLGDRRLQKQACRSCWQIWNSIELQLHNSR